MSFGKIFESTFTGSLVGSGPTVFATWAYVIANARPPGEVEINPVILAAILGTDKGDVEAALDVLQSPDNASRSTEHEGCRLIHEGGFLYSVPTWQKYRDIRNEEARKAYFREAKRKEREKKRTENKVKDSQKVSLTVKDSLGMSENVNLSRRQSTEERENNSEKNENEAAPPLALKRTNISTAQNNISDKSEQHSEEAGCGGSLKFSRNVFLTIAERLQIPAEFAETIYADLELSGGLDRSGNRVVSPASFLRACWRSESVKTAENGKGRSEASTAQKDGIREPWQIEGDIKRVSREIDSIFKGDTNRMSSLGHVENKNAYIERKQDEWIAQLRLCRDEMQQRFPKDLKRAVDEINAEVGDISGVSFPGYDDEIGELVALSEKLPEDFPPFWEWDKRFNSSDAWVDPEELMPEARVKVRQLRGLKAKLETERSNAIANQS